jgi:hypothetical protein
VRTPVVVLVFPAPQFGGELGNRTERCPAIELVLIGSMAALNFPIALRAPGRDVAMSNPEIAQMPGEIGAELVTVIGLDPLNRDRQSPANLVDEGNGVGIEFRV